MDYTPPSAELFEKKQTPNYGILKTLTILTFIGCALSYVLLVTSILDWKNHERNMDAIEKKRDKIGDDEMWEKLIDTELEIEQKSYDSRYLLAGTTLLCTSLCLIGALRMRRLKRSGFLIYLIGELAPIGVTLVVIGFSLIGGLITFVLSLVAITFVVLYATQRKYLIYP